MKRLIPILVACVFMLTLLTPVYAEGTTREVLTENRVYYVRSDGNDSNDCRNDYPWSACKTWQQAVNRAKDLDFNSYVVTIQHGTESTPKTFTESITMLPPIGGGTLGIKGNPTAGWTTISKIGQDVFTVRNFGTTNVLFEHITLTGGSTAQIEVTGNSNVSVGNGMRFGPGAFSHIFVHDNQALLMILNTNYTVFGSADYHIFVTGGRAFLEYSHATLQNTPHFPGGFVSAYLGGTIQAPALTFTGNSTGSRFNVVLNGAITTMTSPTNQNYFPGSSAGYVADGGIYR